MAGNHVWKAFGMLSGVQLAFLIVGIIGDVQPWFVWLPSTVTGAFVLLAVMSIGIYETLTGRKIP